MLVTNPQKCGLVCCDGLGSTVAGSLELILIASNKGTRVLVDEEFSRRDLGLLRDKDYEEQMWGLGCGT